MKNFILLVIIATVIFLSSCNKESIISSVGISDIEVNERSTVIELPVSKVSHIELAGQLEIDFSAEYDFTGKELEDTQYLKFEDSNGNESTLTFQVVNFDGNVDWLEVTFAIGSNNISGLTLSNLQDIVIEDNVIE